MTFVEARLVSGAIAVAADETLVPNASMVKLTFPGYGLHLFPHEARGLAQALIDTADGTDERRPLRRRPETDDLLREIEN